MKNAIRIKLTQAQYQVIAWTLILATIGIVASPWSSVDAIILSVAMLIVGHILLQERLLLVFLLVRPTLDYFRDTIIFTYQNLSVNGNAVMAIALLVWSLIWLSVYRHKLKTIPLRYIFPATTFIFLMSVFGSVSATTTAIELIKFANLEALFFLSYIFVQEKKFTLLELTAVIFASAVIPLLAGVKQIFFAQGLSTFGINGRIYGTFAHPNVFAFFVLSLILIHAEIAYLQPIAFWKRYPQAKDWLSGTLLVLLALTYTRAAFIGLGVFLIFLGIWKYRRLLYILAITGIAGYLILGPFNNFLIATANVSLSDIPLIGRLTTRNEDADSLAWRWSLVQENIPIIRARPIQGYGYGTFPIVWEANRSTDHQWDDSAESHDDYLRLAEETGVFGLLAYLVLFWQLAKTFYHPQKKKSWRAPQSLYLFSWVIIFVIMSASDNMLHHTPVIWFTWAYWGAALTQIKRDPPKLSL